MEDTKTRKAQAWVACNKLGKIWKSSLCRKFKVRLFVATIESVFLCGIETWTLTKNTKNQTDGAFARPDASYSTEGGTTSQEKICTVTSFQKLSCKNRERIIRVAGHFVRHKEEKASKLIL